MLRLHIDLLEMHILISYNNNVQTGVGIFQPLIFITLIIKWIRKKGGVIFMEHNYAGKVSVKKMMELLHSKLNTIDATIQLITDTLSEKCKELGVEPESNNILSIIDAMSNIATEKYNSGKNSVISNPNGFNLYTKAQYDANYNRGRTQGQNDVKNNPGGYGIQQDVVHSVRLGIKGNCGGDSKVNVNASVSVSIDGGAATTYTSSGYVSPGGFYSRKSYNIKYIIKRIGSLRWAPYYTVAFNNLQQADHSHTILQHKILRNCKLY